MEIDLSSEITRYVLRRRRVTELQKTMADLADEDISGETITKGTISNIENFKIKPFANTLEIYLKKINLSREQIIDNAQQVNEEIKELNYRLEAIETIIEKGDLKISKKTLGDLKIENFHPLAPFVSFLKGKIFYEEKNWKQAKKQFSLAIKLHKDFSLEPKNNILSACNKELASCSYFENDLNRALSYVEQGLDAYDISQQRKGIKYQLLGLQILYLIKSSQIRKASLLLDNVWTEVEKPDENYDDYSVLNLYRFRTTFLRNQCQFNKAIQCCNKGTYISRKHSHTRITPYLDFLILAGSIYLKQKEFNKASERFQLALDTDHDQKAPRRHVDIHTYLGILFNAKHDWKQANYHLDKAIQIGRQIDDKFRLTKALVVNGNTYFYQKQFSEAVNHYQEALDLSEKYNYIQRQFKSLLNLGDCFVNLDERELLRDCAEKLFYLQKKISTYEEEDFYAV